MNKCQDQKLMLQHGHRSRYAALLGRRCRWRGDRIGVSPSDVRRGAPAIDVCGGGYCGRHDDSSGFDHGEFRSTGSHVLRCRRRVPRWLPHRVGMRADTVARGYLPDLRVRRRGARTALPECGTVQRPDNRFARYERRFLFIIAIVIGSNVCLLLVWRWLGL